MGALTLPELLYSTEIRENPIKAKAIQNLCFDDHIFVIIEPYLGFVYQLMTSNGSQTEQ